jgi:hypothetical protein
MQTGVQSTSVETEKAGLILSCAEMGIESRFAQTVQGATGMTPWLA